MHKEFFKTAYEDLYEDMNYNEYDRFIGLCKKCNRYTNSLGFDGCMNSNCPHGFEPCF